MRIVGASLHYFDEAQNSDKFYRAFTFSRDGSDWLTVCHWGRYGSVGTVKSVHFIDESAATTFVRSKVSSKIRKGYEVLGDGACDTAAMGASYVELSSMLHNRIARAPVRTSLGITFIIEEEPDVWDLLAA